MIIAGLWRYGDWRHVATGCNALGAVKFINLVKQAIKLKSKLHLQHLHHTGIKYFLTKFIS